MQSVQTVQPLDALWHPRVLMWVIAAGEGVALALALAPGISSPRPLYFAVASLTIQWISLLSFGTLYLGRQRLAKYRATTIARIALAVLLTHTLLVVALGRWTLGATWLQGDSTWSALAARSAAISFTVGLLALAAFQNHWHARKAAVRQKQAELEALQARIRPHFLFNTLNAAAALVHGRPDQAEQLLLDLADLFRAALAGPQVISLSEELALAKRYLEIESLRFGERLRVEWQLPANIPNVQVPALSIQPLVENAIRHGVERVPHGGRVEITLTTTAEHVVVRISNPLVLSDLKQPVSHQVGLNASQARIEALTGGRGSVQTGRQGEHWVATVRLPRRPASADRRRRV